MRLNRPIRELTVMSDISEMILALKNSASVTAETGSAQDLQARQKMKRALNRLAALAHMRLGQFLAEITHVEVNPFDQFDNDAGYGAFCNQLRLNLCEHADAATHRARLNVGMLLCQVSVPCWDDLSPTPSTQRSDTN